MGKMFTFSRLLPRYSPSIFLMALQTLAMSQYCRKAYWGAPFTFLMSISYRRKRTRTFAILHVNLQIIKNNSMLINDKCCQTISVIDIQQFLQSVEKC